jgi:hypothetical protein
MSTKNNPLFESPTPAIAPLALRPRDAAALGVSERLLLEWRRNHGRYYAPPTSTFLSKLFITETCQ